MTDNRTNEPSQNETKSGQTFCFTEAQVEAAAKAYPRWIVDHDGPETPWEQESDALKNEYRADARAALVAAQGAAPQAESGPALRACGHPDRHDFVCACIIYPEKAAPVLPSSGVDEDAEALAKYRSRQKQEATNYREWKRQNRGYGIPELLTWAREAQDNVRFAAGWITHDDYRRAAVPQNLIPLLERSLADVDEAALVQVLETHRYKGMGWCECGANVDVRDGYRRHVARAVAEWLKGQGGESRGRATKQRTLKAPLIRAQVALDALPHGSVVLDSYGDAWQVSCDYWYRAYGDDSMVDSFVLAQRAPLKTIYVAPKRVGLPVIGEGFPPVESAGRALAGKEKNDE